MTVGQTVLLNAKHKDTVQSYKDLNDPEFIVVSKPGTTGEEAVKHLIPKATYETADTEIAGAMRVLQGTADAFVYDLPFNAVFITLHPSNQSGFPDQTLYQRAHRLGDTQKRSGFHEILECVFRPHKSRWSL